MPHLAGKCDCGREIHFPKNAVLGDQWKCYRCGKVWTLSTQGKPLDRQKSKAPPKQETYSYGSPHSSTSNTSSSGCAAIVGVAVFLGVVLLILVVIF